MATDNKHTNNQNLWKKTANINNRPAEIPLDLRKTHAETTMNM